MQVKTFEIDTESTGDDEAEREEANLIASNLGLAGQRLVQATPYPKMSQAEVVLYGNAMPEHVALNEYAGSRLPLRVLQVASHALKVFDETERNEPSRLEVWCKSVFATSDSLLVCITGKDHREVVWLLARWGDALLDEAQLRHVARLTIENRVHGKIATVRSKVDKYEAALGPAIDAYLLTGENDTEWLANLTLG